MSTETNQQRSHSLNMADLEEDCAVPAGRRVNLLHDRLKHSMKVYNAEPRHDSGIGSMASMDYSASLKSTDEVDAGIACENVDSRSINEDLEIEMDKMHISEPDIKPQTSKLLSAVVDDDEGYNSKSIGELPPLKPEEWESGPVVQEESYPVYMSGPSQEAIEAYMQDDEGDTQLHMAIIQLAENIALQLINLAPNHDWLNLCNTLLQTPLHLAVITRQEKIVRRLMAAGASVEVRDLHGNTPLHIAAREGYQEIVAHLLRPVYYEETVENKYEIPYQRVPQDLEAKNYDGLTCLHLSAQGTHTDVMKALLLKGAKVNAQDGKSGRTILHYAAETGNRILLEFLLGCRRLDLDSCTYGGLTPVVLAAGRKFGDVVGILQAHGADCSSLQEDADDEDEDMIDDFCIGGEPLSIR